MYSSSKTYTLPKPLLNNYKYVNFKLANSKNEYIGFQKFPTEIITKYKCSVTNHNDLALVIFPTTASIQISFNIADSNQAIIYDIWQSNL